MDPRDGTLLVALTLVQQVAHVNDCLSVSFETK